MVTIIDFRKSQTNEGKDFISLKVQGGVTAIQSQQTGRMYLTAQTAFVPYTFDELTAKSLIGSTIDGTVKRVSCEPYEYTIKETGEVVMLSHRFEYASEESIANNNVVSSMEVDFLAPQEMAMS